MSESKKAAAIIYVYDDCKNVNTCSLCVWVCVCIMSGMKDWSEIHQNDHSENLML